MDAATTPGPWHSDALIAIMRTHLPALLAERKMMKTDLANARERIAELEAALRECADDLEAEIDARWEVFPGTPDNRKKFDLDMIPVRRARALLQKEEPDDR